MGANAEATVTLSLIDRVTGPIKRIGARLSALSRRIGLDRIGASISNLGNRIRGLGDGLGATTRRLGSFLGLLGAAGAGAIAGAYGLAKSAADVGAEVFDMAGKLGIGAEQLQEYRFAARMSGVEVAAFDKGVEKLGINAVEASKGNKQMAAAFKALGVQVKGSGGKMRTTEEILDDTMSALSSIEDPLKRNHLAFKVFGKSGVELTKILADGAGGLRSLREEARRTGNVFSADATRAADELGDNVDALKERFVGLKNFIGIQLLPVVNDAVKGMTAWYDANSQLVRSTITEWVKTLGGFIKDLMNPTSELRQGVRDLATGFSEAVALIRPFVDFVGGPLKAVLAVIGLWALAPAISAIALLGLAFGRLGGSIAGVAVSGIRAIYDGVSTAFDGAGNKLEASGTGSGSKWGKAFGIAARVAMIAGVALATAELLQAFDPKGNLGGITSPVDNWIRDKLGLPDKDSGVTPGEIWDGVFKDDKKTAGPKSEPKKERLSSTAIDLGFDKSPVFGTGDGINDALKDRRYGLGGGTTDSLPGKAKDDVAAAPDIITQDSNNTTVDARSTVSVSISGLRSDDAAAIAAAVNGALAQRDKKQAAAISSSLSD